MSTTISTEAMLSSSASLTEYLSRTPLYSPTPIFTPSNELDFDDGYDAGCETSPNHDSPSEMSVRLMANLLELSEPPLTTGYNHTESLSPLSFPPDEAGLNANNDLAIGLGLGNLAGFYGTITVMSPNSSAVSFSRRSSLTSVGSGSVLPSNNFPSSANTGIQTIVTTPIGLGLGTGRLLWYDNRTVS